MPTKSANNALELGYINFDSTNNKINFSVDIVSNGAPVAASVYDANTISTGYFAVPTGNTVQKPSNPPLGSIRYNSSNAALETYTSTGWLVLASDSPIIQSISPTSFNGNVGTSFTITGINFKPDATVSFLTGNGSSVISGSVTYVNSTELRATTIRDFTIAEEPLGVRVSQNGGQSVSSLLGVIDCGSIPTWNSSAGSLGTYYDTQRSNISIQLGGTDSEDANANLTFSISSGALPTGLTLSSNGLISGTATAVAANTTNNFSIIISDSGGNQSAERSFSISVYAPIILATYSYTGSDQSFTVPTGFSKFIAHLWGAGAGGGAHSPGGAGGAGGYTTGTVTTTAGTVYAVVVGKGGESRGGGAGPAGSTYGFAGNSGGAGFGGSGGGLSGLFTGASAVTYTDTARAVLVAGGGGGGAYDTPTAPGGPGGGSSGSNGSTATATPGLGASQSAAGGGPNPGSYMRGGTANGGDEGGGGGGGGGYYGGGGGSGSSGGAGGGGSGYIGHASVSNGTTTNAGSAGTTTPPQTTSPYYSAGIGVGSTPTGSGGAGRVVITI